MAYAFLNLAEATAGYAQGVDLELVEGHFFTDVDQEQRSRVLLISEVIANQLFPGQSALGKNIYLGDYGQDLLGFG